MSILYFGGSFDPIHHGHLICARAAAEQAGFGKIVLIPTAQPPHKPVDSGFTSGQDRLEMCRLATAGSVLFETSDIELTLPVPSYTIQTVREIKGQTDQRVNWLIGADMLMYLPKWRQPLELLREVQFVVMARPGWRLDWSSLPPEYRPLEQNLVETPLIDISASDIRRRVKAGLGIDYLTPPAVCDYIRNRGLYR
jgi:nicotinate-nucleotide adenylyltransferase